MSSRDLHQSRDRFVEEHDLDESVRDVISRSWTRSRSLMVQPDRLQLPFVREPNPDSPLIHAAGPVLKQLADGLSEEPISVILTSADGVVLSRISSSSELNRRLDGVQLAPGFSYSEEYAGTNGIGTTLETRQPTLVRGPEHYASCLSELACAGVPIIHPISGALVGALDLTGWVDDGGPLLATLAKSATAQIEGRLLSQASAAQTALLNAYLRACRRSPQRGVLAIGDDVVLVNRRLRFALDSQDQAALLEHAVDLAGAQFGRQYIATLPGGRTAKLTPSEDLPNDGRTPLALFYVQLFDPPPTSVPALTSPISLPGITGSSASWRRACQEVSRDTLTQQWVAVEGETGSGRTAVLKAAAIDRISIPTRIFTAGELSGDGGADFQALEHELEQDRFSIILRDIDQLPEADLRHLADLLQGREHAGWIGMTVGSADQSSDLETLILPHFSHTVPVPALRHRIDDLHELVPYLLRQLGRGAELTVSPAAMRQLCKYNWPGNVAQLRQTLNEVVQRQRSGTIEVDQLPPVVRALSRHTLTQIEALERDAIVRSLAENQGNKRAAATALGISRATIYRKIKEFGIDA